MWIRLPFDDEAPAIGAGLRLVFVERLGRKWVRVRCPFTLRAARLERATWDRLSRNPRARHARRPANLRARVRRWVALTGQDAPPARHPMFTTP